MAPATHEIVNIFEHLDESDQNLVLSIVRRFAPDDIATSDDIETHNQVLAEYRRGEFFRMRREDWDAGAE